MHPGFRLLTGVVWVLAACGSGGGDVADAEIGTDLSLGAEAPPGKDVAALDAAASMKCANGPGLDWVSLPGGTFEMGAAGVAEPVHPVAVPAFQIGRTEVLTCQYRACVDAGTCTARGGSLYRDDWPAVYVDWTQSRSFCQWAGGRLCSEAEWEYAARNGSADAKFPWGNSPATCARGRFQDHPDQGQSCSPQVETIPCSTPAGNDAWGVCDLVGNVWEWVEDDFHSSYVGAPVDGAAWVDSPRASHRVLRGGGFQSDPWFDNVQGAYRNGSYEASDYNGDAGARCCRTP